MALNTDAVHGGEDPDPQDGAVNTRIVESTTFQYPEHEGRESSHIYTRYDNPTTQAVEAKMARLEGAAGALCFASGMAAIHAVCLDNVGPGDTIAVQQGVYGGTMALLREELEPNGVHIHVFDAEGAKVVPDGTRLVWLESVTNPLVRVPDVAAWAHAAHDAGAKLCVDATFATPALQKPLRHGADLVVHSGTKYLGGHSDVTAGFVCFNDGAKALWTRRRNTGATLDPIAGYLLQRGMKTLGLRMARHSANATRLATALEPIVTVHHPSLESHPDHGRAGDMLTMPPGVITLDLGSLEAAQRFRRALRIITPAASLGGVESLASLPVETSHAYATPAARAAEGITDGLVRISVGVESFEDLLEDCKKALAAS